MPRLFYPFQEGPGRNEILEITPDVLWLRSPLPLSLDHVNSYLLKDDDGWAIVDTGMNTEETRQHWITVIEEVLKGANITRVIATHQHPDHVGLAGWLCERYQARLFMSEGEYLSSRVFMDMGQAQSYWETEQFFDRSAMAQSTRDGLRAFNTFTNSVYPIPPSYYRIQDGERLKIGEHEWLAINARGHSPEHVSLYCEDLDLYLSGDQVLARITSNVSVTSSKPESSPLEYWYEAHERIARLVPDSVMVLPAHELPFRGLHQRLRDVIEHHDIRLNKLLELTREPANAQELTYRLFEKEFDHFQNYLAVGECLAHLHMLMKRGQVERRLVDGVYLYANVVEDSENILHF